MIIDCISDLHGHYPKLEGGELLIVAGDLTERPTPLQNVVFLSWLTEQKYQKIIWVAGNHDTQLQENENYSVFFDGKIFDLKWPNHIEYLFDSGTEFKGIKIWGSPWTRNFYGQNPECAAFGLDNETQMKEKFDLIPDDINILITHSPPKGILDGSLKNRYGSTSLHNVVMSANRMHSLKLHVFGHIHECGGQIYDTGYCKFVNASITDAVYEPVHKPVRIIL